MYMSTLTFQIWTVNSSSSFCNELIQLFSTWWNVGKKCTYLLNINNIVMPLYQTYLLDYWDIKLLAKNCSRNLSSSFEVRLKFFCRDQGLEVSNFHILISMRCGQQQQSRLDGITTDYLSSLQPIDLL